MADVKWIKITTDIFDDEKILLIESLPDAYAIIVVWFKLLCLAGKMNNSGVFIMNNSIAYTDKMLSTIFRMKEATVQLALKTFQDFGMIDVVDNVITIPNWGKHQNLEALENRKQYMRDYMQEYRERQKAISCKPNSKVYSKPNVNSLDIDKEREEDKEEDIDKERDIERDKEDTLLSESLHDSTREKTNYSRIVDSYNSICTSLPKCLKVTDARKRLIKTRLKDYSEADLLKAFEMAEQSDFLSGRNGKWNGANIDWILNPKNIQKILEGNYKNKASNSYSTFMDL